MFSGASRSFSRGGFCKVTGRASIRLPDIARVEIQHPSRLYSAISGNLGLSPVSADELIGNVIQVVADDLRLGADPQQIIANTLDQRSFPACRDGAERVPSVAGDKTEL